MGLRISRDGRVPTQPEPRLCRLQGGRAGDARCSCDDGEDVYGDRRVNQRWDRGLDAYASQFGIEPGAVLAHMTDLVGERMAREAIISAGGCGRTTS
jgi:hypothetical protein